MATVYYNGDILTMAGAAPEYIECLVTRGATITWAGAMGHEVREILAQEDTVRVDLGGRSLLPGFIDPHIHPSMAGECSPSRNVSCRSRLEALILSMDWITPFDWDLPDGKIAGVRTEAEYLDNLTSLVRDKTPDDGMILSWGV